jgi:hypothetical protein
MCMLWTYIVTSVDASLVKSADQIDELNSKMEQFVKERVMVF